MQSDQERIISELTSTSMGAPFVYAPDRYQRGAKRSAQYEPADLAWSCNNCLVLMNMTRTGKSREKMIRHNITQLCGGLRAWQRGFHSFKGRNRHHEFDVKFGSVPHVILLSIVHGPDASAEYHHSMVNELQLKGIPVTMCATIPESAFAFFVHEGGSTRDLIGYVNSLRGLGHPLSEDEGLDLIQEQHYDARLASGIAFQHEHEEIPGAVFAGLRVPRSELMRTNWGSKSTAVPIDENPYGLVFNDLAWADMFELVTHVWAYVTAAQQVFPRISRPIIQRFRFPPYTIMLAMSQLWSPGDMQWDPHVIEQWRSCSHELGCPPLLIHAGVGTMANGKPVLFGPLCQSHGRSVKSATERLLDRIAAGKGFGLSAPSMQVANTAGGWNSPQVYDELYDNLLPHKDTINSVSVNWSDPFFHLVWHLNKSRATLRVGSANGGLVAGASWDLPPLSPF